MKGSYSRYMRSWTPPPAPRDVLEQVRGLLERINAERGTHYRVEVQGAEADPGTEPPVYILLHGDTELYRGSKQYIRDRLLEIKRSGGKPIA